ncbi:MAG TPA: hypothetical protein VFB15_11955 [Candidatus Binataceae bacterium]|nr:hypothetical protein [Candidatus Binataceae bacterium]
MIPPRQLLNAIVDSLRTVIGPAISEPYPKSQAFMAAVILEFVARQIDDDRAAADPAHATIAALFAELARIPECRSFATDHPDADAAQLCALIERLYAARDALGPETFATANNAVRAALRRLLDQDLKVARSEG